MGLEKCLQLVLSLYTRRSILIHIVENKAYKSDSDRSLRSYYDRLRERIKAADFNVNNLTLEIKETLEYINSVNEMLEEFRVELLGDVEDIRPFLPEKQKDSLDSTLDKIKEALQGNDIKDITKEIEDASACLAACQSCFTGAFDRCINVDDCAFTYDSGNVCTECVSEQIGCRFCDSDQNTCVIEDSPCGEDYNSACNSCYQKLYNSCSQEQITCNYDAGCTNCQNNVQSCNRCFNTTYSSCSNCYHSTYEACGNDEMSTCTSTHSACTKSNNISCGSCDTCQTEDHSKTCTIFNSITCGSGYNGDCSFKFRGGDGTWSCEHDYSSKTDSCVSGYYTNNDGTEGCRTDFSSAGDECSNDYTNNGGTVNCSGVYKDGDDTVCYTKYTYDPSGRQETCSEDYKSENGTECKSSYIQDGGWDTGCVGGYKDTGGDTCPSCFGTSYGCSGCYDVAYCTACNTAQATCTACVNGQTTCTACVKGEEGHQEDVCTNCYGGCQATWEQQKDCFTGSYGTPPACTICNIGCQYCDTGCYSGQSCGDCGDCGSANCGASNCGSANCGTANCGAGQCNQSGCTNCDDVSACVCSHTGSYGCNFPLHS